MRIISLKIPANSADWTSNYACLETEIQPRLSVRRTRYVSPLRLDSPILLLFRLFLSRAFSTVFASRPCPSDVQPSSMVSSAGAAWLRVQRRKSDILALPTRSRRWSNHCKAHSPSQTAVTPRKTMVQRSSLRPSNTANSTRRQGHCPRLQSLQNTPIKSCPNSLQKPPRRPTAAS